MSRLAALIVGLTLLPLLATIAIAVRLDGGPAFFRQERLGREGRRFRILKFRTMKPLADGERAVAVTAADDPRITTRGRTLRRWRLDELPQLWNCIRGDMAIIGPRPEHPDFADDLRRLAPELYGLKPGLTDASTLAHLDEASELAGRDDPAAHYRHVILPRKLELARAAAAQRGPLNDLRILGRTARRLLGGASNS